MIKQGRRRRPILLFNRAINYVCLLLPEDTWQDPVSDQHFDPVLKAIDTRHHEPLSNNALAVLANMAPTAFIRRFRQLFGAAPQAFYLRKRLETACLLLEAGTHWSTTTTSPRWRQLHFPSLKGCLHPVLS